jgi:hypothetical protein
VHGIMLWKPFQFHELLEAIKIVSKKTAEKVLIQTDATPIQTGTRLYS